MSLIPLFDHVRKFYRDFRQENFIPRSFTGQPISLKRVYLRHNLIHEELDELMYELVNGDNAENLYREFADVLIVLTGTAIECGVQPDVLMQVVQEVMRSQTSKLDADGMPIFREDGKILKGPNFQEPDVKAILSRYGIKSKEWGAPEGCKCAPDCKRCTNR
jgi:predicted HAD superfamily Cof-like phosphohydrolase